MVVSTRALNPKPGILPLRRIRLMTRFCIHRPIGPPVPGCRRPRVPVRGSKLMGSPQAWSAASRCRASRWPAGGSLPGRAGCGWAWRRVGGVVDGAARDHLAVVGEGASVEVEAPGDGGGDLHVGARPELARALHEFGGAVDPQVARTPRVDRGQVVDEEGDLGVAGLDVVELAGPGWGHAADVQVAP